MSEESLQGATEEVVQSVLEGVHTCIPGEIISFDGSSAIVRPIIKKVWSDGRSDRMPNIFGVPVLFLGNNRGGFITDLLPGDTGLIHFSERDFSTWLMSGSIENQPSSVKFDYNDAIFVPGLRSKILPHTGYKPLQTSVYRTDAGLVNSFNALYSDGALMKEFIDAVAASHVLDPATKAALLVIQLKFIALKGSA